MREGGSGSISVELQVVEMKQRVPAVREERSQKEGISADEAKRLQDRIDMLEDELGLMLDRARHEGWCGRVQGHACTCGLAEELAKVRANLVSASEKPAVQP